MGIHASIEKNKNRIVDLFHTIHRNPEISEQEYETTRLIREALTAAGIEVLDTGLSTGLIAVIRGARPGGVVALRADIDALPILEDELHSVRSSKAGVMHACGHDSHTAALLGAAMALQDIRAELQGSVLLLFQPAEEYSTGAADVIATGIFEQFKPSAFFSLHVMPDIPLGKVGVRLGSMMAAQKGFTIRVTGNGSHGASPHLSRDPVMAAVQIVEGLQTLASRVIDPVEPFALSVCSIHGGSAFNIIPDTVEISGTCRFTNNGLNDLILERIAGLAAEIAGAHRCTADTDFFRQLPALVNDTELAEIARRVASRLLGADRVTAPNQRMTSEDFSLYSTIAPIFMYQVGCGNTQGDSPSLHNRCFLVPDSVPVAAADLLACTAQDYLSATSSLA